MSIKDWLASEKIEEEVAYNIFRLCQLQERFPDAIERIANGKGASFQGLKELERLPNSDWFGSLHYLELVDGSGEAEKKLYAVFSPCVPRVGEFVDPEGGQSMEVAEVSYQVVTFGGDTSRRILVPFVYLEAVNEVEGEEWKEN